MEPSSPLSSCRRAFALGRTSRESLSPARAEVVEDPAHRTRLRWQAGLPRGRRYAGGCLGDLGCAMILYPLLPVDWPPTLFVQGEGGEGPGGPGGEGPGGAGGPL